MVKIIYFLANLINNAHDFLGSFIHVLFPTLNDKDMHFWIIGIFGILFYFVVNMAFKKLVKLSVELLSLIYTLTVLIVVVFAIEIQQGITNRGAMEFEDIVAGLLGFIAIYGAYLAIKLIVFIIKWLYKKAKKEEI